MVLNPETVPSWASADGGAWFLSRPENVRRLLLEFPPGRPLDFGGYQCWVVGCRESPGGVEPDLKLSLINPHENYDLAVAQHFHARPDVFR